MSVKVNYKGEEILSVNTDTTKTLKTSGKYCEADIEIINTQDGGITPSGSISITENGTYDVEEYAEAVVDVSGGGAIDWAAYVYKLESLFNSGNSTSPIPTGAVIDMDLTSFVNLTSVNSLFESHFAQMTKSFFKEITLRLPDKVLSCSKLFINGSNYNRTTTKINLPNGVKPSGLAGMFSRCERLVEINGVIDFTYASDMPIFTNSTGNGLFYNDSYLQKVTFKKNCIPNEVSGWWLGSCSALNDASLVSVANALCLTDTTKTLTLHATPKARLSTIMGTVADGIFTADESGTVTLENFVTQTKGWTIA